MKYQVFYYLSEKEKDYHVKAAAEYRKRLSLYCKADYKQVRKEKAWIKLWAAERNRVLILAGPDSVSSETFSSILGEWEMEGRGRVSFFIPHSLEQADWLAACLKEDHSDVRILNLSDFDLNPSLSKVLLLEQIYRGYRIRNNHPYHK